MNRLASREPKSRDRRTPAPRHMRGKNLRAQARGREAPFDRPAKAIDADLTRMSLT